MTTGSDTTEFKRLFDTGAHFAQVKSRRHPSMKPFLVGIKGRQEIIDLVKTAEQLEAAKAVMATLAKEGKTVLFVSEKMAALEVVKRRLDECHLGDAVLELHSHKATKTSVLKELGRTLEQGQPIAKDGAEDRNAFVEDDLEGIAHEVGGLRRPPGLLGEA